MTPEEYIKKYTRRHSNELNFDYQVGFDGQEVICRSYEPYLTVQNGESIALLAREETAEKFAKIIRGNLSKIDDEVQKKFEELYAGITGRKMYGGFKD